MGTKGQNEGLVGAWMRGVGGAGSGIWLGHLK